MTMLMPTNRITNDIMTLINSVSVCNDPTSRNGNDVTVNVLMTARNSQWWRIDANMTMVWPICDGVLTNDVPMANDDCEANRRNGLCRLRNVTNGQ